ncbi:hypothetical protein Trydic_g16244 [Trypoxylus dichotomus]
MDYPFLVSIGMTRKSHFCGGSLLSKNLVLTAGHCCEEEGYFRVWTGLTRVRSLAQSAYVAEIYLHPNYSRDPLSTDLCVLKLASDINENEYTKYVPIINSSLWEDWIVGQHCRAAVAMGFGYQGIKWENGTPKDPNAPYNPIMQCVQLSIIPPDVCQLGMDETMFCAIDPLSEGRDPCQGDSGGPLVCQNVQVGIISAGFGCGIEGYASIYTRVDLFAEYLRELIVTKSGSTSFSIMAATEAGRMTTKTTTRTSPAMKTAPAKKTVTTTKTTPTMATSEQQAATCGTLTEAERRSARKTDTTEAIRLLQVALDEASDSSSSDMECTDDNSTIRNTSDDAVADFEGFRPPQDWYVKWRIAVYPEKSAAVLFSIGGRRRRKHGNPAELTFQGGIIPWLQQVKYLGVTLDCRVNWGAHIHRVFDRGCQMPGTLYPLMVGRGKLDPSLKIRIYKAAVWATAAPTHIKKLETF